MNGRPNERVDPREDRLNAREDRIDAREANAAERDRLADERDVDGVLATAASAATTATSAALTAVSAAATASRALGTPEDDDPDARTDAAVRALDERGAILEALVGQIEADTAGLRARLFRPAPDRRNDIAATMGGKRAG